jgi:hypothetical protein
MLAPGAEVSVRAICERMFVPHRDSKEFRNVKRLAEVGLSDYEIAEILGVPRGTVQRWRHRTTPPSSPLAHWSINWSAQDPTAYCYLLGCYLGDGHVTHRPPNGWTLCVAAAQRYEAIATEIIEAMKATFPGSVPTRFASSSGASDVLRVSNPGIGKAFPQHGPGRKHLRRIVLADWQRQLTHARPGALIRGLIHSDGCRAVNRFRTKLPSGRIAEYAYPRYFFSNLSADIRQIFIEHCELLGIRVTQSNYRNLSISHRRSVAILEKLVGPKA